MKENNQHCYEEQFFSVSEGVINHIATATLSHNGKPIYLKDKQGVPNLKLCMALLGFNPKAPIELVMMKSDGIRPTDIAHEVYVRHVSNPRLAKIQKLYAGTYRVDENFTPVPEIQHLLEDVIYCDGVLCMREGEEGCVEVMSLSEDCKD
ncbi:MAG: hypothetical protein GY928_27005 [Colwellia sp.]|nr:hypothetical protein [Colwellia sp.]